MMLELLESILATWPNRRRPGEATRFKSCCARSSAPGFGSRDGAVDL